MSHRQSPLLATHKAAQGGSRILLASVVFILLLLLAVGGMFLGRSGSVTEDEDAARAAVRIKNLAELQASDVAVLNASTAGHIPIEKAMEAIIPILNAKTAAAANTKQQ